MSDKTAIDGFLTLKKGEQTLLTSEPSVLYIGASADGENWAHQWYIKDVSLPVSLEEACKIFDAGLRNLGDTDEYNAWFDVAFAERNTSHTFTGKALMHSLSHKGIKVALQGTTELAS